MAFILNRTDDRARMPKRRIIATAIVWYFIFLLINFAIIVGVTCIYNKMGVEPGQLTKFVGDRSFHMDRPLWYISQLLLVAPVVVITAVTAFIIIAAIMAVT